MLIHERLVLVTLRMCMIDRSSLMLLYDYYYGRYYHLDGAK